MHIDVEIFTTLKMEHFDQRTWDRLRFGLAQNLRISPEAIELGKGTPGSIRLTIGQSAEKAPQLLAAFQERDSRLFAALEPLPITDIRAELVEKPKAVEKSRGGPCLPPLSPLITDEDWIYFNGLQAETGAYATPPMAASDLMRFVGNKAPEGNLEKLRLLANRRQKTELDVVPWADPRNVGQAGWGIIYHHEANPDIHKQLKPLLKLRQEQAGSLFKVYNLTNGYQSGDSCETFLARHGIGRGPVDPLNMPYYLMIVGGPEDIPFSFQYQLDVQYAVGRLSFNKLADYHHYANSVVKAEMGEVRRPREIAVFAPQNPDDGGTRRTVNHLVHPLIECLPRLCPDWDLKRFVGEGAHKQQLARLTGGSETPALLFSAGHGMRFGKNNPLQADRQGALVCQDWPGPRAHKKGPIGSEYYFSAEDMVKDGSPAGLITFHFACFSAGTPKYDGFYNQAFGVRHSITEQPFVANLCKQLLAHPNGGALACIGHVDRVWGTGTRTSAGGSYITVFQSALHHLLNGYPVGAALEFFNQRYAELAVKLTDTLKNVEYGMKMDPLELAQLWTDHHDARSYVVIGDPAVRLAIDPSKEPSP